MALSENFYSDILEKEKYSIHKALESLRFEAVLNHQQF